MNPFIQFFRRPLAQAIPITRQRYQTRQRLHTKSSLPFGTDLTIIGVTTLFFFAGCVTGIKFGTTTNDEGTRDVPSSPADEMLQNNPTSQAVKLAEQKAIIEQQKVVIDHFKKGMKRQSEHMKKQKGYIEYQSKVITMLQLQDRQKEQDGVVEKTDRGTDA
tara:strand:- start:4806 stop:5288 length:483 start_codon:yes stop_codon:yes gene_type:complete